MPAVPHVKARSLLQAVLTAGGSGRATKLLMTLLADIKTMPQNPEITRAEYPNLSTLPTRWMDNDVYGHINNALYYAFFDTAINQYLIAEGGLDIIAGQVIAFAVESQCRYLQPLAFPGAVEVGLRVGKLGNSSVRYELAIFKQGQTLAAAAGYFVHVFVDRQTQRPVAMPEPIRAALARLVQ